jgi:hypothetical protein
MARMAAVLASISAAILLPLANPSSVCITVENLHGSTNCVARNWGNGLFGRSRSHAPNPTTLALRGGSLRREKVINFDTLEPMGSQTSESEHSHLCKAKYRLIFRMIIAPHPVH